MSGTKIITKFNIHTFLVMKKKLIIDDRPQLFFLDLHASSVGINVINWLARHPFFGKLAFLKSDINKKKIIPIILLGSSFPIDKMPLPILFKRFFVLLEYFVWKFINDIKGDFKISMNSENKKKIIIIDSALIFKYPMDLFDKLKEKGYIFLFYISHYHYETLEKINFFNRYPESFFFSEIIPNKPISVKTQPIKKNKHLLVPYYASYRFFKKKNIERSSKILITGSLVQSNTKLKKLFLRDWGSKDLHPLRLSLHKLKKNKVFEKISSYYDYNFLGFIFSIFKKKNYYSIDLPTYYQKYKYFICPEDVSGYYSSNMCEGMASGCVYFANKNLNYLSILGMKPWVHYIPHNGTINDILKSYKKIQNNKNLYNIIKKKSQEFALNNFTIKAIHLKFNKELKKKIIRMRINK